MIGSNIFMIDFSLIKRMALCVIIIFGISAYLFLEKWKLKEVPEGDKLA